MIDIKYHYLFWLVGTKDDMLTIFNNRDNQDEISRKNIDMENYLVKQVEVSQFQFFDKSYHIMRIRFNIPLA